MARAALRCGLCQSCVGSLRHANTFIFNKLSHWSLHRFLFFQHSTCLRFYLKRKQVLYVAVLDFAFHYSGWFWWVRQFLLCSPAVLECGVWNEVQPTARHTWIHSTHQPLHINPLQTSLQLPGTSVLFGRATSLQFLQGLVSSTLLSNCFCYNVFFLFRFLLSHKMQFNVWVSSLE